MQCPTRFLNEYDNLWLDGGGTYPVENSFDIHVGTFGHLFHGQFFDGTSPFERICK